MSAGTSMVMPTWLLGSGSVLTERLEGTRPILRTALSNYGLGGGDGDGTGTGVGLASTGPVPGSGGTVMLIGVGVGLGGLSPGSREMLVVSVRYQLLLGPATTSAGCEYQRSPG